MNEMIENIAIRIWETATPLKPGPWNDALQLWERASEKEKHICRLQAHAAIEAMREPTMTMLQNACKEAAKEQCRPIEIHITDAAICWQTMIDTALSE